MLAQQIHKIYGTILTLVEKKRFTEAKTIILQNETALFTRVDAAIDEYHAFQDQRNKTLVEEAQSQRDNAIKNMAFLSAAATLFAAIATLHIHRGLTRGF